MHFYGSGLWINITKGRFFPKITQSSVLISKNFNSDLDYVRSLRARESEVLKSNYEKQDFLRRIYAMPLFYVFLIINIKRKKFSHEVN